MKNLVKLPGNKMRQPPSNLQSKVRSVNKLSNEDSGTENLYVY